MMYWSLCLALASGAAALAQPFVVVIPSTPSSVDEVRVETGGIWNDGCVPGQPQTTIRDSRITIRLAVYRGGGCTLALRPWSVAVPLGRLAPGEYEAIIEILDGGNLIPYGSSRFSVTDVSKFFEITPDSGPINGGTEVTFAGHGLAVCRSSLSCIPQVLFGGVPATAVRVLDDDRLLAVAPPHSSGQATVEVKDVAVSVRFFYYFNPATEPDPSAFTRVLFPIFFFGRGGFGSEWITDVYINNSTSSEVAPYRLLRWTICAPSDPCTRAIRPEQTVQLAPEIGTRPAGILFYPPRHVAEHLNYSIHIRDVSRAFQSWGTEIPIVRDEDFRSGTITLLNIPGGLPRDPAGPRFRQTLRIYDTEGRDGGEVLMKVFILGFGVHQLQQVVTLRTTLRCILPCGPHPEEPAYAQVDLSQLPVFASNLRIDLVPLSTKLRFWAFVSVTNNETQHVTTITPQ